MYDTYNNIIFFLPFQKVGVFQCYRMDWNISRCWGKVCCSNQQTPRRIYSMAFTIFVFMEFCGCKQNVTWNHDLNRKISSRLHFSKETYISVLQNEILVIRFNFGKMLLLNCLKTKQSNKVENIFETVSLSNQIEKYTTFDF